MEEWQKQSPNDHIYFRGYGEIVEDEEGAASEIYDQNIDELKVLVY